MAAIVAVANQHICALADYQSARNIEIDPHRHRYRARDPVLALAGRRQCQRRRVCPGIGSWCNGNCPDGSGRRDAVAHQPASTLKIASDTSNMTILAAHDCGGRQGQVRHELPVGRWLALVLLLVAETLLLSVRFDTGSLASEAGMCAEFLGSIPLLIRLSLVAAVAVILFSGPTLLDELVHRFSRLHLESSSRRSWLVPAHLASLGVFVWLTRSLLEEGKATVEQAPAWVAAWVLAGICSAIAWAWALFPATLWWQLGRRGWQGILVGCSVGAMVWCVSTFSDRLWRPLAASTFQGVEGLLGCFGNDVVSQPDKLLVGTSAFAVQIAPECSGYEGVGLIVAFLGAYLCFDRHRLRFPQALVLLPLGAAVAWVANVVRITMLVAIGGAWSPAIALGGFHSQAGWLAFNAIALGLVAVAGRSSWLAVGIDSKDVTTSNPAAPYLVPLLATAGTAMITRALSDGFDAYYPHRTIVAACALWYFRGRFAPLRLSWSWSAVSAGFTVFVVWTMLVHNGEKPSPVAEMASWPMTWSVVWWTARVAGFVVIAPLVEELAFRGFLTRRLMSADFATEPLGGFTWPSFLISSVLFGVLHGGSWVPGTLAGMAYALALRRRGRLGDAIVAHATTNGLLAVYAATTGNWLMWS